MIIALVVDTFNTNNNGTTISAMRFAETLTRHGHAVRVIAQGDIKRSGLDTKTGYDMYYVPENKVFLATYFAHKQHTLFAKPDISVLKRAISGADVVHIYQPFALGRAAQRIAEFLDVPTIAAFHVQPENITYNIGLGWSRPLAHLIYRLLYRRFYRRFSHIHCPSKFIAAQLRSHRYKARLHVISNGVHPKFCPELKRRSLEPDVYQILMVGRLSPEKRQDLIIRAARKSRYADRIQLYFAGQGPWEQKLKSMGKSLPREPIFGYYQPDELIALMRTCDLYIHASDIEIEGISCIEAFSCGLVPIISDSKYSATAQFALGPKHLFKAGSSNDLASKIDMWLADPKGRKKAGEAYALYAKRFLIDQSVRRMETVYRVLSTQGKNAYHAGRVFTVCSRIFYTGFATPLLYLWTRLVLGVKIYGGEHLRGLDGALTVCNHVHMLDSALVALALFPRKIIFPTLPENLNKLWPGLIVRLAGCVPVPGNMVELKLFFDEMELLLLKGRIVHFFPEGDLNPYDTNLRGFKKGAFYLAAQARVPLVPMSIAFRKPKGFYRLIRRKPMMTLNIGQPVYPLAVDTQEDTMRRMEHVRVQMEELMRAPSA